MCGPLCWAIGYWHRCGDWHRPFRGEPISRKEAEPRPSHSTLSQSNLRFVPRNAWGRRMAGVDLLRGSDGRLFVLEVNAVPGWKALAAITGVDVAAEILSDLLRAETAA